MRAPVGSTMRRASSHCSSPTPAWPRGGSDRESEGAVVDRRHPQEVKDNEFRIAATPEGVRELVDAGQTVLIEEGRGSARASPRRYKRSGAQFVSSAEDVRVAPTCQSKVKEPIASGTS